jgi:hypothetical protein
MLEELRSGQSVRILGGLRNSLWLQFSQISAAWRNHKTADGNVDITTLARLGTIVEATRVAVAHILRISGDAISIQTPCRPTETFDPNPYTALSDFHREVMTSAHPDSPHARRLLQPGGAARMASHTSFTPSSGRPDHVTRAVTQPERKATVHQVAPTQPEPTYVTKSAVAETIDWKKPEARPQTGGMQDRLSYQWARATSQPGSGEGPRDAYKTRWCSSDQGMHLQASQKGRGMQPLQTDS